MARVMLQADPVPSIVHWVPGELSCNEAWEAAYTRFETPGEERQKFRKRLLAAGAASWPKDSEVVDLFCGRGNGLFALESLGFSRLRGVDLSPTLLAQYRGPARLYVGDCRELHFADRSCDLVVVQGGLHHLPTLPDDLERVLREARRILRPSGRLFIVEPWLTPFLRVVHGACELAVARRAWNKLDALATMTEHERDTYMAWLARPESIVSLLRTYFRQERCKRAFGKLSFVGRPRA